MAHTKKAFTLIEIVLVVVIISVLATITIVAVNPTAQIEQANDTQRGSDITAILNAVYQYSIDNGGTLPPGIVNTNALIGHADVDLCSVLVPDYLSGMPFDPTTLSAYYNDCTDYNTFYEVRQDSSSGRLTITAANAQVNGPMTVSR